MDFARSATELERQIRGCSPWPGTFTFFAGKQLKIMEAEVLSEQAAGVSAGQAPGTVLLAKGDRLYIQTGDGILAPKSLHLEGKKRMDTAAFLAGARLTAGTVLGE